MRSAVSTGGNVSATAEVLAAILHEFGLNADQAASTMDKLHIASAEGNLTLEQFSQSFGQVAAFSAAVGVPLDQAAAAMAAMTRHGFDAATAATQVKDEIVHLINPSAGAAKALLALSVASGVNLVGAMSATNLHARGLTGVMDEITGAMNKAGLSADQQTALWLKLVPNIRGGAAAFVLAGRGAQDFRDILGDMDNSLGVTDEAFARIQDQPKFQWDLLTNQFHILGITIGETLLPPIARGISVVTDFVQQFLALPASTQEALVKFTAIAGVVLTLAGGFVLLAPVIGSVISGFAALGSILLSPLFLSLAAASAVLVAAWQTNLGNIQGIVSDAFGQVPDLLDFFSGKLQDAGTFWEDSIIPPVERIGSAVVERLGEAFTTIQRILSEMQPIFASFGLVGQKALAGDLGGAFDSLRAIVGAIAPPLGSLLGIFQNLGGFVATQVVPGLADLADRIMPALGQVGGEVGQVWDTLLRPALENVGNFLLNTVAPNFLQLASNALPTLQTASETMAAFWDTKMQPAFQKVSDFIDQNLLKSLADLGTGLSGLTGEKVNAVADVFSGSLVTSLSSFGNQLQPLVPVFQSFGSFFASVGNVFAAFAELQARGTKGGAGEAAEDPLTSSLRRLAQFVNENADLGNHMLALLGPVGQALDLIVTNGDQAIAFFNNVADALNKFAGAIRSLPELPDWLQKALGAPDLAGAAVAAGSQIGQNVAPGLVPAAGAVADQGGVHFNAPITINTPVQLDQFIQSIADALNGSAKRVNTPPDNTAFPALATP